MQRISVKEALDLPETATEDEVIKEAESYFWDGVMPACCEARCRVEPDGKCPHGHPSIMIAMGLI